MSKSNSSDEYGVSQFADQLDRIEKLLVDLHRKLDGGHHVAADEDSFADKIISTAKSGGDISGILRESSRAARAEIRKWKKQDKARAHKGV